MPLRRKHYAELELDMGKEVLFTLQTHIANSIGNATFQILLTGQLFISQSIVSYPSDRALAQTPLKIDRRSIITD